MCSEMIPQVKVIYFFIPQVKVIYFFIPHFILIFGSTHLHSDVLESVFGFFVLLAVLSPPKIAQLLYVNDINQSLAVICYQLDRHQSVRPHPIKFKRL